MNYSDNHSLLELGKKYHYGSEYIKQDYEKAKELYTLAVYNKDYIAYLYLGVLHIDEQNIQQAIHYFHKAVEKGYFQCFINLGDIYFYEKEYIDLDLAEQYYLASQKYSTFESCKVLAQDKLKTLRMEKNDNYYEKKPLIDIETLLKYDLSTEDLQNMIEEQRDVPAFNEVLNVVQDQIYHELEVKKNDRQNVHDHVVSNTVKKSIENLQEHTEILIDKSQALIDIRKYIEEQTDHTDIANQVLDHVESDTTCFRNTNLQFVDVLHLVWNRIHNECNIPNISKLKDNLYQRLLECNEYDSKVCASGIFSRIIDTLNYCDGENIVEIMPKYALNRELMDKASVISKNFQEEQLPKLKELILKSDLQDEEVKQVNQYTERLKHKLVQEFRKDYVDTGIIDEPILYLEINKWIQYI